MVSVFTYRFAHWKTFRILSYKLRFTVALQLPFPLLSRKHLLCVRGRTAGHPWGFRAAQHFDRAAAEGREKRWGAAAVAATTAAGASFLLPHLLLLRSLTQVRHTMDGTFHTVTSSLGLSGLICTIAHSSSSVTKCLCQAEKRGGN